MSNVSGHRAEKLGMKNVGSHGMSMVSISQGNDTGRVSECEAGLVLHSFQV